MAILNFHLVVSGDLAAAQQATRTALDAAGFTVTEQRDHWKATHGSVAKTMFLGLRAHDADVREVLDVSFADLGGTVRVDLHRPIFQPAGGSDDGLEQPTAEHPQVLRVVLPRLAEQEPRRRSRHPVRRVIGEGIHRVGDHARLVAAQVTGRQPLRYVVVVLQRLRQPRRPVRLGTGDARRM